MPQIPTLTAGSSPGVLRLPRATPEDLGAGGWGKLRQAGEQITEIGQRLQRQQDELDLSELAGLYDQGVGEAKLRLQESPDYQEHTALFARDVRQLQTDILAKTRSAPVQRALTAHFSRVFPREMVNVQADALRLQAQGQVASLDRQEENLSRQFALDPDPEKRASASSLYMGLVDKMEASGTLNPEQAEKRRLAFTNKADKARAVTEMESDPEGFSIRLGMLTTDAEGKVTWEYFPSLTPEQRHALASNARELSDRREKEIKEAAKESNDAKAAELVGRIDRGEISDAELQSALEPMPYQISTHLRNYRDARTSRVRQEDEWVQRQVTDTFLMDIPLATEEEVRAVGRRAEIAFAQGRIDAGSLTTIKAHVQNRLDHLRQESRGQASDEDRKRRREYASAEKEIQEWLGLGPHEARYFSDAYTMAVNRLKAAGATAIDAEESPRAAMLKALPEATILLFGSLDATEGEMWARLAPYTSEAEFGRAIADRKISDPTQRARMLEAYRTIRVIQQLKGTVRQQGVAKDIQRAKQTPRRRQAPPAEAIPVLGAEIPEGSGF